MKTVVRYIAYSLAGLLLLSLLLPLSLVVVDPPLWSWRVMRAISPPANYPTQIQHQWVDYEDISKSMVLAVIAAEDQLFYQHSGFDIASIKQAWRDAQQGQGSRGASTITQQLNKNLFLTDHRSLVRKGAEAWLTLWTELFCSKRRILELYLNVVEFGPGIYGVEAAAQHYFGIPATRLSAHQSAQLAAVLPNPYRYSVQRPSSYVQRRVSWISRQMRQLGLDYLQ